jgi:CDP-glucose 4,6-dehydratase
LENTLNFDNYKKYFSNKRILITGNAGFKGSWLSLFLTRLGSDVYGYSISKNLSPIFSLPENKQFYADIKDFNELKRIVEKVSPDIIFHLAASAITINSYSEPRETFETNVMGTLNVLESLRNLNIKCNAVVITSDKCYKNDEWIWAFRETDELGGVDPYSASKSMAELATKSYYYSYFMNSSNVKVSICRAGNVFGGGDWGEQRIVPECIRSWSKNRTLELRNPDVVRPWNYVLDLINGYLLTAYHLESEDINGDSFCFGPPMSGVISVEDLTKALWNFWPDKSFTPYKILLSEKGLIENKLFKLFIDKAFNTLNWESTTNINDALNETVKWYTLYLSNPSKSLSFSNDIVERYICNHLK